MVDIGSFDRKIWLLQPVNMRDSSGGEQDTYEDYIQVYASRKDENGGNFEQLESQRLTAKWVVSWGIRYRSDIDCSWRVRDDRGVVYDIKHIAESKVRKQFLYLKTQTHD